MKTLLIIVSALLLGLPTALTLAGTAAPGAPSGPSRTLAVIPFYSPEKMWQLYTPLVDYLRRETGEDWNLKLYANHDALVTGVCAGEVDVTLLGPVPLGRVNRACGALPFLVPLGKDGKPEYHSVLLTGDPAITSAAGLRGKKIGFFKGSTAAHILPLKMLLDAGLGPGSFEPVFLESQDRIMTALLAHEVAAGGVKEALYRRFEKDPVRALLTSVALPNFAFSALPSQPPARRERFVKALLKLQPLKNADDAQTVKGWDDEIKNGFTTPAADFLPSVLKVHEIYETVMHESH